MEIGIIVQARMGSSRLPGKMTLPFYNGKGIFENILIRLIEAQLEIPIIIATTDHNRDDCLEEIALKQNIKVYRGSENNVLDRFIKTAEANHINKIIRICADNPFIDINSLKKQIEGFKEIDTDYFCYCKKDKTPTILTSFGFWSEGVSLEALKKASRLTNEALYLEHVTNYIYKHSNKFSITYTEIDEFIEENSNIRLTVDTPSDFNVAKEVFLKLTDINKNFNSTDVIKFVKTNENWLKVMKTEISENIK